MEIVCQIFNVSYVATCLFKRVRANFSHLISYNLSILESSYPEVFYDLPKALGMWKDSCL